MSFNAIRENKILAKINESTVFSTEAHQENGELLFFKKVIYYSSIKTSILKYIEFIHDKTKSA